MKEDHRYLKIELYWKDAVATGYMAMTGRWLHMYATEVIISSSQWPENFKKTPCPQKDVINGYELQRNECLRFGVH